MTETEQQLAEFLDRRASEMELQLTPDDIRRRVSQQTVPERGDSRRLVLAAAAALIVLVGGAIAVTRSGPTTKLESVPAPAGTVTRAVPTTAIETVEPEKLTIEILDTAPTRLADGAVVLKADRVGVIEVGFTRPTDFVGRSWVDGGQCVATTTGVGCVEAPGQLGSTSQADDNAVTIAGHGSAGYFHVFSSPGSATEALPFFLVDQGVALVVSGLPDSVAVVHASVDDQLFVQTPVAGTAAFPSDTSARLIRLTAYDAEGVVVWESGDFEVPFPASPPEGSRDFVITGDVAEQVAAFWNGQVSLDRSGTDSSQTEAGVFFRDTAVDFGGGRLLLGIRIGESVSVAERSAPLATDGSAAVYLGTDGPDARAVELVDGERVIYARSDDTATPMELDELIAIVISLNQLVTRDN